MARLTRKKLNVFAENATNNGVFGSLQANNPTQTSDVEQIQSLPAWSTGWNDATMTSEELPPLEEFQGVQYVSTYQTAYLLQEGVPEWIGTCEYYNGSWVKSNASGEWELYQSLVDNNVGNLVTDTSKWKKVSFGGGLEVGDVGIAPLGIDETQNKRRYLNGQVISQTQFMAFATKVKSAIAAYPSLGTTEALWQQAVSDSDLGQCGQFVVDDVNQTIRLPKVVNIQGLQTLSGNLGTTLSAGLPNILGQVNASTNFSNMDSSNGSFGYKTDVTSKNGIASTGAFSSAVDFDASRSSSIYGNSSTVQEEAVQYPYFIQVATGNELDVDITTEVQLSNPFFFGMYQWFQSEPSNSSWLLSGGQYNSRSIYESYYDWLYAVYSGTETLTGFNVKDTTQAYTNEDFVLNLNDETFRLPLEVNGEPSSTTGMTLYFYVGAVVQDADVINAGAVINEVADLNSRIHIVETYHSGTDWYRLWSDGWCEQGGITTKGTTINLLKPFKTSDYIAFVCGCDTSNHYQTVPIAVQYRVANSFKVYTQSASDGLISWFACGYVS